MKQKQRVEGNGAFAAQAGGDINQVIRDSFNRAIQSDTPQEVKEKLAVLAKLLDQLILRLGEEQKCTVRRDFSTLSGEAAASKPRKNLLSVTAEGLIEAAKTCAELAEPITRAVKAVLGLFP